MKREVELVVLVGLAHATSHFFHLVLPTLFPWLMRDFGLGFIEAGSLVTAFFVVSGVGQAASGFVVDHVGPRRVLWAGVSLLAMAGLILASARSYPMLVAAALVAGMGNSVFHPADFTVLNHGVSPSRLGHAFSAHALCGNLGWAAAPVLLTAIARAAGWRAAALASFALAAASLAPLVLRRAAFSRHEDRAFDESVASASERASAFAFLRVSAVWMCFLFFFVSTMAFGALQSFGPIVFGKVYGLSLQTGASAQTTYLLGGAAGIALGGVFATRSHEHDRVIAASLGMAALAAVGLATGRVPAATVTAFTAGVGFLTGFANPSRELLVRRVSLARFGRQSFGRIYGFVYSGVDAGLSTAPILFGFLMDRAMYPGVLIGVAVLQVLAVGVAMQVGTRSRKQPSASACVT